ncbi:MAG: aminoglycoside phosphotransferase family protein [Candidatus Saccharimonadales bacterium]
MQEEVLTGNESHPIVRIGDKVHRPVEFWQPAIYDLLNYLESVNFPYSPKHHGIDDHGREVLDHIEGESGKEGWKNIISDEGLRSYAKLLRNYHDAVAGYKPSSELEWANSQKGLKLGQTICHGDFGPWNIVWKDGKPVGIVDWDLAHPNTPEYDILYALEYSAPFRDDETTLKGHHFKSIPDRKRRIEIFLSAYGTPTITDVAEKVAAMQREVGEYEASLASRGIHPQVDWVAEGDLEEVEKRARWTEQNSGLFELR